MTDYWWGTHRKTSGRMQIEIEYVRLMFNINKPTIFRQPVSWDTDFWVITRKANLNYDNPENLFWTVQYAMKEIGAVRNGITWDKWCTLQIVYPKTYPGSAAQCNFKEPDVANALHHYPGGKLCLYDPSSVRDGWDPAKSTGATVAAWSLQWLRAFIHWKVNGEWPEASG